MLRMMSPMVGAVARSFVLRLAAAGAVAAGVLVPGMVSSGPVHVSAQTSPTPCVLTLLSQCVGGTTSTPDPSNCLLILCPTPTPTPDQQSNSTQTGPCDQLPACPSPQPTCLLASSTDPTCLLATPAPSGSSGPPSPTGSHGPGPSHTSNPSGGSTAQSTLGGFNTPGGGPGGLTSGAASPAVDIGINVPPIPEIQPVGAASALHFGHAPILWPLFGALDLVGLAGVFLVLRRVRARRPD